MSSAIEPIHIKNLMNSMKDRNWLKRELIKRMFMHFQTLKA